MTGQDGAYLARFLLEKGYHVLGAVRQTSAVNMSRLEELTISSEIELIGLDLLEFETIVRAVERIGAAEVYNLAAQSSVQSSFEQPLFVSDCSGMGAARILEALRIVNPAARFFQASTSAMFDNAGATSRNEASRFQPQTPYGVAKLFAHGMTVNYRQAYGLHASAGIMFSHESPLRSEEFVTRKITVGLARIKHGLLDVLELGNLDACRDWGYAPDYVEGMWQIVRSENADDYVLATGETHSVREFATLAGAALGFDLDFRGTGTAEHAFDLKSGRTIVRINPRLMRPVDLGSMRGNAEKARDLLGWKSKTAFAEMVTLMAEADERRVRDTRQ
ncbi:GDP-mannose 4,6-dehydratase [uncultured Bradyrhizobium sp.]|uniref:GDP-mannose 4,6-dehydratase n=1 Tax=uncultured Bradyrhizobium sp. TaxID=199684 RepID=UPI0035CA2815